MSIEEMEAELAGLKEAMVKRQVELASADVKFLKMLGIADFLALRIAAAKSKEALPDTNKKKT